jgi:excisionase family DNA binding protein
MNDEGALPSPAAAIIDTSSQDVTSENGGRLLTASELGEQLGFAAGTIVDWAEAGTIPHFKIGGRLRFRASEVEAWLGERHRGAMT